MIINLSFASMATKVYHAYMDVIKLKENNNPYGRLNVVLQKCMQAKNTTIKTCTHINSLTYIGLCVCVCVCVCRGRGGV